jgi:cell wall-associated NlpC family hydrolase
VRKALIITLVSFLFVVHFVNPSKADAAVSPQRLIAEAQKMIGTPYRSGGTTPKGFDCSGFVYYAYKKIGKTLPRSSAQMYKVGKPVSYQNLIPGDLVFFKTSKHAGVSHVAIYIGKGRMIHATSSRGVKIDSLNHSYWRPKFVGAKRL